MRGRKYTESGTICKGDTRGTAGQVWEHGLGHAGSVGKWPRMCRNVVLQGVTSAGKPGGCKHVRTSVVLGGSPECAEVCGACAVSAGRHGGCADIAGMVRKVRKCAGVRRSTARPGMRREVESIRNE